MAKKSEFTAYEKLATDAAMFGGKAKQLKQNVDAIILNKAEQLQENGEGKGNPNFIEEHQKKNRDYYAEKALKGGEKTIKADAADARVEIHDRKIRTHNERLENDPDYAERIRKAGKQLAQAIKVEGESGQQLPPKATGNISKGEGR